MATLLRIAGILYLVFILIAPALPGIGYDRSLLPEAGEFEAAQQRLRASLPQKENPAWSNIVCLFSAPTTVQSCVEQRQEYSKLRYMCAVTKRHEEGSDAFNRCLEEQRQREDSLQVSGSIDPTINKPTKAELVVDAKSFPQQYDPQLAFPFELKVDNPRQQEVKVDFSCNFTKRDGKEVVAGRVEGINPLEFRDATFQASLLCFPEQTLNGSYMVTFAALFTDVTTSSRLQRAFIGDKSPQEKERLRREEIARVITVSQSQAPADFAHLNFDLGHAAKEIIIENKEYRSIVLRSNIENTGPGQLLAVKLYRIDLPGFAVENPGCIQGSLPLIPSFGQIVALPTCIVTDYPEELKNPEEWVPRTFEATITYNYLITKKVNFDIRLLS